MVIILKNKLSLKNINKTFHTKEGELVAIENITFDIKEGEIIALVGTSGCGKSTLLNIIANIESPTSGECLFDTKDPKISYMLQSDALLPWKSVLDNACLGLELEKNKNSENVKEVEELLKNYGLGDFLHQYPNSLSGGMKQRVALIRSLAIKPDIILLDEPFSALDFYTRITISQDVRNIIKEKNTTAIIITHDIQEALSIGDKVIVLSSRPSKIKNIYDVPFKDKTNSVLKKREFPEFNSLYDSIWSDLDVEI